MFLERMLREIHADNSLKGFFICNLIFNAIMWGLFTRALTLASSTVRVSVINTSANFMLTAVLGLLIFRETLPGKNMSHLSTRDRNAHPDEVAGLWWLGASFLVAGSVIIGRREEGKEGAVTVGEPSAAAAGNTYRDEPDAPLAGAGGIELEGGERRRSRSRGRAQEESD